MHRLARCKEQHRDIDNGEGDAIYDEKKQADERDRETHDRDDGHEQWDQDQLFEDQLMELGFREDQIRIRWMEPVPTFGTDDGLIVFTDHALDVVATDRADRV